MKDTVNSRRDLVFVGIRLLGVYFAVSSIISLVQWLQVHVSMNGAAGLPSIWGVQTIFWGLLPAVVGVAIGLVLALRAGAIEAWFGTRDRAPR